DVPEDRDEAELAQHREEVLDAAGPAERAGRDADDARRLVDVLLEAAVENVLQEARVAVVVLGRDDHDGVGAIHPGGEARILDRLASVAGRERKLGDVDEIGLDAGPACERGHEETRVREALATL